MKEGRNRAESGKEARKGISPPRLKRVIDFVEKNLGADIELHELAEAADMSLHYFAKMFKESMGVTPHQYLTRRRIERAKTLLRSSRYTVSEISLAVGFVDQSHFTNVFRKMVGTTPRRWREGAGQSRTVRRKVGERVWHFCPTCSGWPVKDYRERESTSAVASLCNECRVKLASGRCV